MSSCNSIALAIEKKLIVKKLKSNNTKPVVFLMGPTASGKTDIAIKLCQNYPFEIVNADAAQIYKQMDIGTAKPDKEQLRLAPHRLIDFIDPANTYSAVSFRNDALNAIKAIHDNDKIPLLVGGSMFYFKVLEYGVADLPSASPSVRDEIQIEAESLGWPQLHKTLAEHDPQLASKIKANDKQRIQRALEIIKITGHAPSKLYQSYDNIQFPYLATKIANVPFDRSLLHSRIECRFKKMIGQGLIEEVESLKARGDLSLALPSMRTVGYKQVWAYLDCQINRQQMIETALSATRQLAKRQLTWLRHQKGLVWLGCQSAVQDKVLKRFFDAKIGYLCN